MALLLLCVLILFAALGMVQAWTIWYLRREVARLEFRLGEALDDEDLLEFQDRLKALLAEAKAASAHLAKTAEARREELERTLDKARQAEKSLALRLVAKSAADAGKPSPPPRPKAKAPKPAPTTRPPQAPLTASRPVRGAAVSRPLAPEPPPDPALPQPKSASLREKSEPRPVPPADERRSYLARPKEAAVRPKHQHIYELADQGMDVEAIARQSGLLAGEVDLILSLRRKPEA